MSQLNKVSTDGEVHWFASDTVGGIRKFGGVFTNPACPWRQGQGKRFTHYSVTRMANNGGIAATKYFRKLRHAKKCLSKWVNS